MADGVERVYGYLAESVRETSSERRLGVEAATGPDFAAGQVIAHYAGTVARIKFSVKDFGHISSEIEFNPDSVGMDEVLAWAKAIWDGASTKGFPDSGWKH